LFSPHLIRSNPFRKSYEIMHSLHETGNSVIAYIIGHMA
jgi:hypothetical protein